MVASEDKTSGASTSEDLIKRGLQGKYGVVKRLLGRKSAFAEKRRALDLDEEWVEEVVEDHHENINVVRENGRASSVYSRTTDGDVFPDEEAVEAEEEKKKEKKKEKEQGESRREYFQERGHSIIRKMKAVRIRGRGD